MVASVKRLRIRRRAAAAVRLELLLSIPELRPRGNDPVWGFGIELRAAEKRPQTAQDEVCRTRRFRETEDRAGPGLAAFSGITPSPGVGSVAPSPEESHVLVQNSTFQAAGFSTSACPLTRGIVTNGSQADDERAMRTRVLVSGLTFFAVAMLLAVLPLVAQGHTVSVSDAPCEVKGTAGPDILTGTGGADVICGFGGDDLISGLGGKDILKGGAGKDTMGGGNGDDVLRGGNGSDRMQGDGGRDVLLGLGGNDWLWAWDGTHDHLNGGSGTDHYRVDGTLDRKTSVEAPM